MSTGLPDKPVEEPSVEPTREAPVFTPRFDIVESEEELILYGDLPGVSEDSVEVRFQDEQLIIHGRVCPRNEGAEFIYREYGVGDFHRTFSVGEPIDAEKISAELRNGVLTIHLPKSEAAKPRRIPIKSA